ncbi:MAG: glyoxalase, partial [Naasia sp.]|nr:glyoxalase [Naasia sp.]
MSRSSSSPASPSDVLAADTAMGAVTLAVADLDAMVGYYRDGVGLDLQALDGGRATLGRLGRPALVLEQRTDLRHASPSQAGLYHTAFVFPERSDLAAAVYSVASKHPRSFTGSSDHLVSEALYFNDPEGNGVELYWDRPREEWQWTPGGVRMGPIYLVPTRVRAAFLTEEGAERGV